MFLFLVGEVDRGDQTTFHKEVAALLHEFEQLCCDKLQETCPEHDLPGMKLNRSAAKSWLLNAISSIPITDPSIKRRRFAQFLPGGTCFNAASEQQAAFGHQLVHQALKSLSNEFNTIICSQPTLLRSFFSSREHPQRINAWFAHFSMNGMSDFKHGALALAQYALKHRDDVWNELVWRGKHSQAPVAVASKPHYFCELDIVQTVLNLTDTYDFWASEELKESINQGSILSIDPDFFVDKFYSWLKESGAQSDQIFGLVCDYIEQHASWRELCHGLLPLLSEDDVLRVCLKVVDEENGLKYIPHSSSGVGNVYKKRDGQLALLVFNEVDWTFDELLFAVACSYNAREFAKMLVDSGSDWEEICRVLAKLNDVETFEMFHQLRKQEVDLAITCGSSKLSRKFFLLHILIAQCWLRNLAGGTDLATSLSSNGIPCTSVTTSKQAKKKKKKEKRKKKKRDKRRRQEEDFADIPDLTRYSSSSSESEGYFTTDYSNDMYSVDIGGEVKQVGFYELQDVVHDELLKAYVGMALLSINNSK